MADSKRHPYAEILVGILAVVALLLIEQYHSYVLFHVLVELFAVVVAIAVFIVAWNTRRLHDNGYLVTLGIAFLFIGIVDLLHALAYKGMGTLITQDEIDVPTQLWLVARYLQAFAFLVAPAFLVRKVRPALIAAGFAAITFVAVASVVWLDVFPSALTPEGLTPFKVTSEYVISAVLLVAAALLWRKRERFEPGVLWLILGSIGATIASEMAFTLYVDPYGALNLVGHVLKVLAIYMIYRALVVTALQQPFALLFREISEREAALAESEQRFRTTFEKATVGISHVSLDGHWLRVNERLTQITGYTREELAGRPFLDVNHPEERLNEQVRFEGLISGQIDEYWLEKRIVRKDGVHRWVSVRRSLLRDDDGTPKYIVSITEDIDDRKRAEAQLARAKELSDALTVIDSAINSTLDFSTIVHRALVSGAEAIHCETASVALLQDSRWEVVDAYRFRDAVVGHVLTGEELPQAVLAATTKEPVAISNAFDDDRVNRDIARRYETRSTLVVPLISRGEAIGAIFFNYRTHTHWFTTDELTFATSLASALATAVENARLYEEQFRIADTLQSALLSFPSALPGVDFDAAYRSSEELARIGGDFYDAFELEGGRVGFLLGDVSGKGLNAATITAAARSTLRAFAYLNASPASVLAPANAALARQLPEERFVTVLYGVIDPAQGVLTVATAGHPPAIVIRDGGPCYLEMPPNPPLGLFEESRFADVSTRLRPGEIVIAFSDGALDARAGSDFFGEERLLEATTRVAHAPAAAIVRSLLASIEEFTGGVRTDDIAIAAFRVTSDDQHGTEG